MVESVLVANIPFYTIQKRPIRQTPMIQRPSQDDIEEPITSAPPEVEHIIREVIKLEKANLSGKRTRIREDVLKIIKDTVK